MDNNANGALRVGIVGLGAIGQSLAQQLLQGVPGCRLTTVIGRDHEKTKAFARKMEIPFAGTNIEDSFDEVDVFVECAPPAVLPEILGTALDAGKKVIVVSVGALLNLPHFLDPKRASGGQIIVPTGALIGLDAVNAAAEGTIHSVRMVSRKPPRGLIGAPFLTDNNIDLSDLKEPLKLFEGTAREAASGFPANLNVAVALSLAGVGPDKTMIEVWADPTVTHNTHHIKVDSDSAKLSMTIENIPSENPKTGRITAQSVTALLRKMSAPLRVGT